jgi:8-oxo-dGTP pyrophosphatase MutT (NUDIX family)
VSDPAKGTEPAPILPASTVVLVRDGIDGIEVLMLRRNSQLAFHGGAWVFPGGRVDPDDADGDEDLLALAAALRAGVREAQEEAGIALAAADLVPFAQWLTPPNQVRRFDTWFLIGIAPNEHAVSIDGSEIHAHEWMTPPNALARRAAGEIELPPPTFVTLTWLQEFDRAAAVLEAARSGEVFRYVPRPVRVDGGIAMMYAGDAGYDTHDIDAPGPRHRLWALGDAWRYERSL